MIKQDFADKFAFTPDENRRFTRMNYTKLVYTNARFEGVKTTLPQTQRIMDGMSVAGVPIADVLTIINLKRGWQFISNHIETLTFEFEKEINKIVAAEDSLEPGNLRSGLDGIYLSSDEYFEPPMIDETEERDFLNNVINSKRTTTDKAMTIMYHNMRQQMFWDGNKRTAVLVANKMMIDGGAGLINVPLDLWAEWHQLIADFYRTNEMQQLKAWTYQHAIQGLEVRQK